mmetsp:Transcript_41978/g.136196  ORF Transcript_41978/g.136196 Transcript_41978/m.136196 type:complete len:278 (+) Transcript_41978:504-1337(+)
MLMVWAASGTRLAQVARRRRQWGRRGGGRLGRGRRGRRGRRQGRKDGRRLSRRGRQQGLKDECGCAAAAHADDREEGDEDAEQVGLAEAAGAAVIRVERGVPGPRLGREGRALSRQTRPSESQSPQARLRQGWATRLCAGEGPKAVGAADRAGGLGGVGLRLDLALAEGHHPIAVQSSPSARVSQSVHAREGGGKAAERTCRRGGRLCRSFVVRAASGKDLGAPSIAIEETVCDQHAQDAPIVAGRVKMSVVSLLRCSFSRRGVLWRRPRSSPSRRS